MKIVLSVGGGLFFAFLFHNQFMGLNTILFTLFLILSLLFLKDKISWNATLLGTTAIAILSSFAICYHGGATAHWSYFTSILLLVGFVANQQSSVYISLINGIYSFTLGIFHDFLYPSETKLPSTIKRKNRYQVLWFYIGVPMILLIIFTLFYQQVNPVFDEWLQWFYQQFETIDFLWFFTATTACYLLLNVLPAKTVINWTAQDLTQTNQLDPIKISPNRVSNLTKELNVGLLSMIVLNLLLVIVLVSEFVFLFNLQNFGAAELSVAVHQGVYSSIGSIVLAVGLMIFLFRGALNWLESSKKLRIATYGWMFLNSILLVTIACKNYAYITQYGLTEKRIGVVVYLILCFIGIITAYFKIKDQLNFTFVVRRNLAWCMVVLLFLGLFNWSAIISEYNIERGFVDYKLLYYQFPHNIMVLKRAGIYEEVLESKNLSSFTYSKVQEELQNRNWREFNYTFYKAAHYEK